MKIERFEDYAFVVNEINEAVLGFRVVKIIGHDVNDINFYSKDNDTTTDFEAADPFLSGSIKWDGCSNWDFHDHDCMVHFCGRADATSIGRLMDHLYTITSERLDTFDSDLGA